MSDEDFDLPTDFPTNIDINNSKPKSPAMPFLKKVMNALNLISYIVVLSTYLVATYSNIGINNLSDEELLNKHPTLLTPNYKSTKFIWGVIFFSQGVFAVAQLWVIRCRDHILLVEGIGPMYILASFAQLIWYVSFAYGMLITSFVFLFGVFVCAVGLLARQYQTFRKAEMKIESKNAADMVVPGTLAQKKEEFVDDGYWLLRFPFGIYAGWISCMIPLMLSIVLSTLEVDVVVLVWVAVMSVALLTGLSMGLLLRKENGLPSYSMPSAIAYFFCGVRVELEAPNDIILAMYDEAYLNLLKNVSAIAAVMLLVTAVSRFGAVYLRDRCMKKEEQDDEYDATAGLDEVDYVQA
mmetsp:Transcript_11608/g.17102  ORF Transcript_11608/g.17102 Transcript_11608/m.17102 type:complete len:352 (+) Transcript_11608:126-1181(+)